jgi:hypothetical protein
MSEHFSDHEFFFSRTALERGIDNAPTPNVLENIAFTMAGLERVRAYLGFPMKVLSGYRCDALNEAIGGARNSQHVRGEACDFVCPAFGSPRDICLFLSGNLHVLGIDQLIFEGKWVHVSFSHTPRFELLTWDVNGNYVAGIV